MSDLKKALKLTGCNNEEMALLTTAIGSMRRLLSIKIETLKSKNINEAIIDEIMCFKDWHKTWKGTVGLDMESLDEAFTDEVLEAHLLKEKPSTKSPETERKDNSVSQSGLNIFHKVETKETPKLLLNKSLKGKIFYEWNSAFLCQDVSSQSKQHHRG